MKLSRWKVFLRTFSDVQPLNYIGRLKESFFDAEKNNFVVPSFKKAVLNSNRIAVKDSTGDYTYFQLFMGAKKLSSQISNICGSGALTNVAYISTNSVISPLVQWGSWISGQVVVPLVWSFPLEMLKFIIRDAKVNMLIVTPQFEALGSTLSQFCRLPLLIVDHTFLDEHNSDLDEIQKQILIGFEERIMLAGLLENDFYNTSDAMILYSTASTGKPKGAVLTHKNIYAQINSLIYAWKYSNKDSLLHVLPLYHTHSNINSLLCPLTVGATVVMHEQFDSHNVWKSLLGINAAVKDRITMFIGVPSMYAFLISEYDKIFAKNSQMVEYIRNYCKNNIRLMISGSAPLPENVFNRWKDITGHSILERYGMSEAGIVLSNPLIEEPENTKIRKPGFIGVPLPGVKLRIVDNDGKVLMACEGEQYKKYWDDEQTEVHPDYSEISDTLENKPIMWEIMGELEIAGDNVFKEYYNKPELSKSSFDSTFFKTGDEVAFVDGGFKLMGRINSDIIITGGYKVYSAEVESALLTHPSIRQVVVMGVPDLTWGERVVAVCVLHPDHSINLKGLRSFCSQILPTYKHPSILKVVKEIPTNSLLKIDKERLGELFFAENVI